MVTSNFYNVFIVYTIHQNDMLLNVKLLGIVECQHSFSFLYRLAVPFMWHGLFLLSFSKIMFSEV